MYKELLGQLHNTIKLFKDLNTLKSKDGDLNKYQSACFEQINSDLNDMRSFVKSLEFISQHKNEFKVGN
ncbi:MAG: hypothetical protein JXB50_07920 [Spirochaetes bacterium]|nr:hypothetical protein [Spirochaetota bacterium]